MSGYGGVDDESLHAIILVENESYRVQEYLVQQSFKKSRSTCKDCCEIIPPKRLEIIKGCEYCVICQVEHETVNRPKMLQKML